MRLKDDLALEGSSVVANCSMNRERELAGTNGYGRDLGFDIAAFLERRLGAGLETSWLDLCCGRGRALIEAAVRFAADGERGLLRLQGVDLVGMFDDAPKDVAWLVLEAAPLRCFAAGGVYDLITCVHGLHYVGDKLGTIARAVSWLAEDGVFAANLDLANLELTRGSARRRVPRWLRSQGVSYEPQRRRVSCRGARSLVVPWRYVGADDTAGPNYTGQPAVTSVYAPVDADGMNPET